jgi:hypothetical protein
MPASHGVVIAIGRSQYQTGLDICSIVAMPAGSRPRIFPIGERVRSGNDSEHGRFRVLHAAR